MRWLVDAEGIVNHVVCEDQAAVQINRLGGVQSTHKPQLLALNGVSVLVPEFGEILLGRLGNEARAVSKGVLLRAISVVRGHLADNDRLGCL